MQQPSMNCVFLGWLRVEPRDERSVSAYVLPLELELTFRNNLLASIIMLFVALSPNTPIRSILSYAFRR